MNEELIDETWLKYCIHHVYFESVTCQNCPDYIDYNDMDREKFNMKGYCMRTNEAIYDRWSVGDECPLPFMNSERYLKIKELIKKEGEEYKKKIGYED